MLDRGIITIAMGDPRYLSMANDLALSLKFHSPALPRAVVTDMDADTNLWDHVIPVVKDFGDGLRQKLHLPFYSPFQETLFIDSDSLVFGNLHESWPSFQGQCVGYIGNTVTKGEWCNAKISDIMRHLNCPWVATLNSGFIYFTDGSEDVFNRAASAQQFEYEKLGFAPFRDTKNDEPGFAIALTEASLKPLADPGKRMSYTPIGIRGRMKVDVFKDVCSFIKGQHGVRRPQILHFATWHFHPVYYRERAKIRFYYQIFKSKTIARLFGQLIWLRQRFFN